MLGLDQIVDEYEHAKTLLWDDKPDSELEKSAKKVNKICDQVISELKLQIKN